VGLLVFFIISRISTQYFEKVSLLGYIFLVTFLIVLLLIGQVNRGIVGWIDFGGGFRFQPSQLAIPLASIYVITVFKKELEKTRSLGIKAFAKILFLIAVPGLLILFQPDLGTAMVYFFSLGVIFFHPSFPLKYLVFLATGAVVSAVFAWFFVLAPYQKNRILSFASISESESELSSGAGYNAEQSLIAVGSGQFLGRGLGQGVQSHLRFLPERQTDFIFASFAEEWGFIGSSLVVVIYFILILFILSYALKFPTMLESIYSLVLAIMLLVQAGINIGMNIGILPITGITLPLLSYGGSSILAIMIMLGIYQSFLVRFEKKGKIWFS
jgi:rod shape determining protein RodA